MNVHKTLAL